MTELTDTYKDVRRALEGLRLAWEIPPHVIWRLAWLIGDETIAHVDGLISPRSGRSYTGTVVLFTDTRVIRATMDDSPVAPQPGQRATFSVQVETWSRGTLTGLAVQGEDQPWRNSDGGWNNLNVDGPPGDLSVTLTYTEGRVVTLPLAEPRAVSSDRIESLFTFAPSLFADL